MTVHRHANNMGSPRRWTNAPFELPDTYARTRARENAGISLKVAFEKTKTPQEISTRQNAGMAKPIVETCERLSAREAARNAALFGIEWRACNFGGERPYVKCPCCPRTVLHLYPRRDWFACRVCVGRGYASQKERTADRARRAARKIRKRLGASENLIQPILFKPKYMKQATFNRLRARAGRYEGRSLEAMSAFIERLRGKR